jgi:hypothetical protein
MFRRLPAILGTLPPRNVETCCFKSIRNSAAVTSLRITGYRGPLQKVNLHASILVAEDSPVYTHRPIGKVHLAVDSSRP